MTKEEARQEIAKRMDRETAYVLAYPMAQEQDQKFLRKMLKDNDRSLRLLGRYLETEFGDTWEKFYRENYWALQK